MADELTIIRATPIELMGVGSSLSDGGFAQANNNIFDNTGGDQLYLFGEAVLTVTFSVAPVSGEVINLYRRDLKVSGTSNTPLPDANYLERYLGSFIVKNQTTAQTLKIDKFPLYRECSFVIENQSGQTMPTGWSLSLTPYTYKRSST